MGLSRFLSAVFNLIVSIAASVLLGLGIWLKTKNDGASCLQFLSIPIIIISVTILVIAFVGFVGAYKNVSCLLWIYAFIMFIALILLLAYTIFAFVVTNEKASSAVSNKGIAQYKLGDYSHWLQKRVNNTNNWTKIKSCINDSNICHKIYKYNTSQALQEAKLTPIMSGCCIPPTSCNFTFVNATYWKHSTKYYSSSNHDCYVWSNQVGTACFNCNTCKAGVLQNVRKDWRLIAYANLVLFLVLFIVYSISCCAYRSSGKEPVGYRRGF